MNLWGGVTNDRIGPECVIGGTWEVTAKCQRATGRNLKKAIHTEMPGRSLSENWERSTHRVRSAALMWTIIHSIIRSPPFGAPGCN